MTVLSKIAIATVVASTAVSAVETKKKTFGEFLPYCSCLPSFLPCPQYCGVNLFTNSQS